MTGGRANGDALVQKKGKALRDGSSYRHCPNCRADVAVERRIPKITLLLVLLAAVSLLVTVILFPRFVFLFLFLPFGFGLWRKADCCARCGRRLPPATACTPC